MSSKISLVVLYGGNNNMLSKTLLSITKQKRFDVSNNTEILVVNPTDKKISSVTSQFSNIKEVKSESLLECDCIYLGIEKARFEHVAFFNSGDTINDCFFHDAISTLNKFKDIPFVAVSAFCVNPSLVETTENVLNGTRFIDQKIINVKTSVDSFHISLNAAVFKTQILKKRKFNSRLKYESIINYMINLLLEYPRYATCTKAQYYYFMPQEDDFLYFVPSNYADWYTKSIIEFSLPLLEKCEEVYGKIPKFIQVFTMYMIQNRFLSNLNNRNKKNMDSKQLQDFFVSVKTVLQKIDDRVIVNKNKYNCISYSLECGQTFIYIKYGYENGKMPYTYTEGDHQIYLSYNNIHFTTLAGQAVNIHVMDYRDGKIFIDASFRELFNNDKITIFAYFKNKKYIVENNDRYSLTKYFGISAYKKFTFHLEIPLSDEDEIQKLTFFAKIKTTVVPLRIGFIHHWAKLAADPVDLYWRFRDKYAYYDVEEQALIFKKARKAELLMREIKVLLKTFPQSKNSFIYRCMYWITKPYFKNKRIWYMYDKMYKGGDSSEYMYRYCKGKKDGITRYYVIDEDTPDYKNFKKDGFRPLKNKTLFAKMAFINADIVLITNANTFPFNGLTMDYSRFVRGFCNFQTMCLQHGLSVQKCAMAQQRVIDNTVKYFLASKYEAKNLEHHVYDYKNYDALKITGIARYDGLKNNDKKQILISPTWRMYNAMPVTTSEGEQRSYNPEFKNTLYYKIYNDLINDEKLINSAKKYGYKIKYLLHPILSAQAKDFTPNSELEVIPSVGDLSYEKILTQSSLLVTDYSGIQFDFAYMKKPLVYFHPSQLPAHYEDGCFFYDTMGFGEIINKTDLLVDILCEYMKNNCKMKDEYIKRVDDFYNFSDYNNCERIYKEIYEYQKQVDNNKMRKLKNNS